MDFRLAYSECDPAGIVYYAAYYPWFERIYNEWALENGFPPAKTRELWGTTHISVASACEYKIPGKLHDPFTAKMRLGHIGTTSLSYVFDVDHRESGLTYARGKMVFVYVDEQDPPRPVQVPQQLKDELTARGAWWE
jgi:acyl-CoA thioester hydrolase